VLELVGLEGWENYFPHELSGGMRQRVGLARALAVDPEYLLCDEPFSALDPLIRREMQDELVHLQKMVHKTLIFITHDFHEALKLGDHICIMKDGEFVQIGTPEEIVSQPADDYVREFTRDVPRAKVLTARAIMTPVSEADQASLSLDGGPEVTDGVVVSPDTKLEALIPFVVSSEQPVPVVDRDNRLVGFVDRQTIMLALAE
jgi:glycine betaine/proline transport system ATP-binding protein